MLANLLAKIRVLLIKHPLITESVLVAVAMLLGKLASFVWKITTARQGTQIVGEIEFILTTTNLIAALAIQGLPMAVTIWTAKLHQQKKSDQPLLLESVRFGVVTAVILSLLALIAFQVFPQLAGQMTISPKTYLWIIPGIVLLELLSAWFNGRKLYDWYALGKYLGLPLFRATLYFGLLYSFLSQESIITLHLNTAVVLLLAIMIIKAMIMQKKERKDTRFAATTIAWQETRKKFWNQGALLSGSMVLYVIYSASDVYWLSHFHTPTLVGTFSLTLALASLLELVFYPVLNLLQTRLSVFQQQPNQALSFLGKNIGMSAIIGGITAIGLMVVKPLLVPLFGVSSSAISSQILGLILVWKLLENLLVLPLRHYFDFFGHQRSTLTTMSAAFVAKLLLSWLLIPTQGIMGVVLANIGAEIIHAAWLLYLLGKHYLRNGR